MMKFGTYASLAVSLFLLLFFTSCSGDCYESTRVNLGVEFGDKELGSSTTLQGVTIKGVGSDSTLYNQSSTSLVYLPLKINADSTTYSFSYVQPAEGEIPADTLYYTIDAIHNAFPHLISAECGCAMYQHLSSIQIIPLSDEPELELELVESALQNLKEVHVKIYF